MCTILLPSNCSSETDVCHSSMTMERACYYFRGRQSDRRLPEFLPLILFYWFFRSVLAVAAGGTNKKGYYFSVLSLGRVWVLRVVLVAFLLGCFLYVEPPAFWE